MPNFETLGKKPTYDELSRKLGNHQHGEKVLHDENKRLRDEIYGLRLAFDEVLKWVLRTSR